MVAATCAKQKKSLDKISGQLVFLNVALMALERKQAEHSLWSHIHRSVQTIRATCEQAGMAELEQFANDLEDLVRLVRDELVVVSGKLLGLVRSCAETFECSVASLRIGVPISYEFEEVRLNLRETLVNSSLEATHC